MVQEIVMVDTDDGIKSRDELPRVGKVRIVTGKSVVRSRVTFSNDSRSLFCAYGCEIRVHSIKTGELVSVFEGHNGEVTDLCLSESNPLQLLSCCLDGGVFFWDILDGSIVSKCKSKFPLHGISVHKHHPDTLFLVKENKHKHERGKYCLGMASVGHENKTLGKEASFLKFKKLCCIEKSVGTYSSSSKGELVASVLNNNLQIWYFAEKKLKKYPSNGVVSIAFHPSDLCLATGHVNGKITIWRNLGIDLKPICTKLHWHAHPVESIAFSFDGAYLYSGGEESVLVFWQFETGHKQFKPRLGSPITHISNNKDDTIIAVCHTDNVINLVSAVDLSVVNVLQRLTKATHLCTGVVADPLSKSLVLNSRDGILQFYRPDTDKLAFTLNIVRQNYISKPGEGDPLQMIRVEQVSFSRNGDWLATVERRDDRRTTPEIRLKFWRFNEETQRHVLNTCIDPPHEDKVVAVEFQPGSFDELRAMSASVDGKFKIWILKEQQVIKGVQQAWHCQSVGYLREEPVQDATFSSDGSLLAVGYGKVVTLWDPCTNELKTTLYSPFSQIIKYIKFGRQSCSHVLLAATKHEYLVAWNLLSCTVIWSVKAEVLSLLPDPLSHLMAVFVPAGGRRLHVYIFDPRSAIPLGVVPNALRNEFLASTEFQPNMKGLTIRQENSSVTMAKLFYMSKKQVLMTIDDHESADFSSTKQTHSKPEESEFYRVFGEVQNPALQQEVSLSLAVHRPSSSKVIREMLSSPSHVLPPVTTLCSTFLRSLLISKSPVRDADNIDEGNASGYERDKVTCGTSTSEEGIGPDVDESRMQCTDDHVLKDEGAKPKEFHIHRTAHELHESNFEWMKELFDSLE